MTGCGRSGPGIVLLILAVVSVTVGLGVALGAVGRLMRSGRLGGIVRMPAGRRLAAMIWLWEMLISYAVPQWLRRSVSSSLAHKAISSPLAWRQPLALVSLWLCWLARARFASWRGSLSLWPLESLPLPACHRWP